MDQNTGQNNVRQIIDVFLKQDFGKHTYFESQKVVRPSPNHFLSYEIYSKLGSSEHETISELNKMEKEGLLEIEFRSATGWVWYIKH